MDAAPQDILLQSEPIIMRLDREMADALCKIDPGYKVFERPDGSLYVQLKKPLYGLIEAAKLWFDEISRTLLAVSWVQAECLRRMLLAGIETSRVSSIL
jgi:hypothetical protein